MFGENKINSSCTNICLEMIIDRFFIFRYTQRDNNVYAIVLQYNKPLVQINAPVLTASTTVSLLGYESPIKWSPIATNGILVDLQNADSTKLPNKKWSSLVFRLTSVK
jgi:hypothetical protein